MQRTICFIHSRLWWMLPPIWHHLQVYYQCPCPLKLQEATLRIDGVFACFLMSNFDQTFTGPSDGSSPPHLPSDTTLNLVMVPDCDTTFTEGFDGCSLQSDTIFRTISNSIFSGRECNSCSLDMVPDLVSSWNFHRRF